MTPDIAVLQARLAELRLEHWHVVCALRNRWGVYWATKPLDLVRAELRRQSEDAMQIYYKYVR